MIPTDPAESNDPKKRTSISITEEAVSKGRARARALGYDNFSTYIEFLIQRDAQEKARHVVTRDETGTHYVAVRSLEDHPDHIAHKANQLLDSLLLTDSQSPPVPAKNRTRYDAESGPSPSLNDGDTDP